MDAAASRATINNMKRLFLLLMLICFAAGCVEIEVHTKMDRSGKGVQTWHFQTTALLAGEIQKAIENDPFFKKGKKVLEEFKEGDFITVLEYPFTKVNELAYKGRDIQFDRRGWVRVHCTYTEVWDKHFGDVSRELAKHGGSMIPLTLKVSVEMPGRIVRTNAPETDGSTVSWKFTVADITGSRALMVESVYWNWALILPTAGFFLLLLGGGTAMLVKKRAANAPILCPSCASKNPKASTFCASCGVRLRPE